MDAKPLDAPFPRKGLDLTTAHQRPAAFTTPVGVNVRVVEPARERARGGSRPGLSPHIGDRLAGGNSPVQHLAGIVTADGPWLLINFPDPSGTFDPYTGDEYHPVTNPTGRWVRDPSDNPDAPPGAGDPDDPNFDPDAPGVRNPGRRAPPFGWGPQPRRRDGNPPLARPDYASLCVGDAATDIDVLANDSYQGTPTIEIVSGPLRPGATAEVTGKGAASRIRYTPPASGDGGVDTIGYRLQATRNTGLSANRLEIRVSVCGDGGDPGPGSVVCVEYSLLCGDLGLQVYQIQVVVGDTGEPYPLGCSCAGNPTVPRGTVPSKAAIQAAYDNADCGLTVIGYSTSEGAC